MINNIEACSLCLQQGLLEALVSADILFVSFTVSERWREQTISLLSSNIQQRVKPPRLTIINKPTKPVPVPDLLRYIILSGILAASNCAAVQVNCMPRCTQVRLETSEYSVYLRQIRMSDWSPGIGILCCYNHLYVDF